MKNLRIKFFFFINLFLLLPNPCLAERYSSVEGPVNQYWIFSSGPIGANNIIHHSSPNVSWYMNVNGCGNDGPNYDQTKNAVQNAFYSWQAIASSDISFQYVNSVSNTWSNDGKNVIFWAELNNPAFDEDQPLEDAASTMAVTVITVNANEEITDADIIYNGWLFNWKINGDDPDIESVAAHEIGHLMGLSHTDITSTPRPTMYEFYEEGTTMRTLENDDKVGASFLYTGNLIVSRTLVAGTNHFDWGLTISANKTLFVQDGTTILVKNGKSINVYGALIPYTSNVLIDFISPNSSTQNGLKLFSNNAIGVQANYVVIQNGWYGIYTNGYTQPYIRNFEIKNCYYGVYFNNSTSTIQNNYIHNNQIGIALYGSSPILYSNQISYNSYHGVYCSSSSNPKFGSGATHGNNNIHHNSYKGIFCYNNSYPIIGKNSPVDGGYNILEQNVQHNVYSEVDGVTWAVNNWWGSNPPDANKIYCRNGAIAYNPWLTGPPSMQMNKNSGNIVQSDLSPLVAQIVIAQNLINENKLEDARNICLNIIENYSDSAVAFNALNLLSQTYLTNEKSNMTEAYASIFDKNSSKKLSGMAGLILARTDIENKIKIIDEVISKHEGEEILELALYDKFLHYYNTENDLENATKILAQLEKQFPKSEAVIDAYRLLGMPEFLIKNTKSIKNDNLTENKVINDFNLLGNYPNPFNPTTTISYSLPRMSDVELIIYDLLGNEVKSYFFSSQTAGSQNIIWNGTDNQNEQVASGIYIYSFKAISLEGKPGVFEKSSKLILMK